jgi:large subunit ribosomal protein L22
MIKAKLKHLRISPRKVRLAADLIRGLSVREAEQQLIFLNKRSASQILRLLRSAVANAQHNASLPKENLYISEILVDAGPTLKRWRPRAMGRASNIMKRTSHVTIVLNQKGRARQPAEEKLIKEKAEPIVKKEVKKEKPEDTLDLLNEISQPVEKEEDNKKNVLKPKKISPPKPYRTTSQSKKKFFSRQTFGNAKKIFRRKSI